MLILNVFSGSMRFPAVATGGNPVSPVTVRVGFQPLLISTSNTLEEDSLTPETIFILLNWLEPISLAF